MNKIKDISIFIFAFGVVFSIGYVFYTLNDIQNKYAGKTSDSKTILKESANEEEISERRKLLFDFIEPNQVFDLTITEFYENTTSCATETVPYALIIGITTDKNLPEKVSVLSYCEERIFNPGEKVKIVPEPEPLLLTSRNPLNPLYFVVTDTVVKGEILSEWIIGSENKAIWGKPKLD